MDDLRESVSAVFVHGSKLFVIKRQNYLSIFPGYHAFPGGKVDKEDTKAAPLTTRFLNQFPSHLMHALVREVQEELGLNLVSMIEQGEIDFIGDMGHAVTPEFNPYRFKNYYYKIELKNYSELKASEDEAAWSGWSEGAELKAQYHRAEILAVPPMVSFIEQLGAAPTRREKIDLELPWISEREVPMFQPIYGVHQLLPLSHTFPPANRTNAFIIGDSASERVLIDPSPKDLAEYEKLKRSLDKVGFNRIFITHHHPDHHEFAPRLARDYGVSMGMSEWTHKRLLKIWGKDYLEGIKIDHFKAGDTLTRSLGQAVKVYSVPGHDEGQLALAPENLNWYIVGDLIQTVGTVVIGGEEGDMAKYFHSLEQVIALNPRFIIPSHGIAMGGVDKLKQTLQHRRLREQQIKELWLQGKTLPEVLAVVYEGLAPELHMVATKTIEAHLKKLAKEQQIRYEALE